MRITEAGNRDGPPVVLVHGLSSTSRCWARTTPALGAARRLLLVDLFAGSRGGFSLERAAEELASSLVERRIGPAAIVGHSMGGLVALQLAHLAPGQVARLVLVDAPVLPARQRRVTQLAAVARSTLRWEATAAGIVIGCLLRTSPLLLLAATRATLAADLGELARHASVPTLLVWGADDGIVPAETGRLLAAEMASARLVVLPGAGHQPMWEDPAAFNEAVCAFLAESDPPSAARGPSDR